METALKIFTDGGCSGNPGPGGWAYVMVLENSPSKESASSGEGVQGDKIMAEQWGAEKNTTNNRMELTAVIESLRALKTMEDLPRQAAIYTDSQYVQKGITGWIRNWKRNAWRTSDKKPVKNQDLWIALDSLAGEFSLKWEWVPGHAGVEYNERCDRMTREAIRSIIGN
jgi:ribonuclease HI